MQNDRAKIKIALLIVFILLVALGVLWSVQEKPSTMFDGFAQCLTDKGYVMYGAYWCTHCKNEKKAFGNSFRLINYVECTEETKKCETDGIKGFPTWLAPDGVRLEGEQGIKKLSEVSGCPLLPVSQD